jgi:hypothetical protein
LPAARSTRGASAGWRARALVRDGYDLVALEHAVLAERRHLALVRLRVAGADSELDRLLDLAERAAPQPLIVVQVRITLGAAAARAVTRSAVLAERRAALRIGEIGERLVSLDVGERGRGEAWCSSVRAAT